MYKILIMFLKFRKIEKYHKLIQIFIIIYKNNTNNIKNF